MNSSRRDDVSRSNSNSGVATTLSTPKVQINKYTGKPFSQRFWDILSKRKKLPVWDYYSKFVELVKNNQCVVLVGETGSGKTTQVRVCDILLSLFSH